MAQVDPVALAAVALLVAGVVGSALPALPGAPLSLAGVYLYWWQSGYAVPSLVVLAGFTVAGLLAVAADHLAAVVAARAGGASSRTALAAGIAGLLLFFVAGPLGVLVGVAGTAFALEYRRHRDARRGATTAAYAAVGLVASAVVQVLVTLSMLAGFLLVVL